MKFNYLLLVFVFVSIWLGSCKNNTVQIESKDIIANWDILEAKRNGTPTSTLENAIFYINDKEIVHNFNGDTVTSVYTYENNVMTIQDELIQSMEIVEVISDTLKTKTKIKDFKFDFIMVKNE